MDLYGPGPSDFGAASALRSSPRPLLPHCPPAFVQQHRHGPHEAVQEVARLHAGGPQEALEQVLGAAGLTCRNIQKHTEIYRNTQKYLLITCL